MNVPLQTRSCGLKREWDELVRGHRLGNLYCSWTWGEYKKQTGWRIERLIIVDDSKDVISFVQVQIKKVGVVNIYYLQGGPLFSKKGLSRADAVITEIIERLHLKISDLLIVNFEHFSCSIGISALLSAHFLPMQSSRYYTIDLDLSRDHEEILRLADHGWRKSLRKAERNPDITNGFAESYEDRLTAFDRCYSMHLALQARKGFTNGLIGEHLRELVASDSRFCILEIKEGCDCILVRIAHISNERFTDFMVGSNERARTLGVASLSLWRFMEKAASLHCSVLDLGGVDPGRNQTVFNFKRGLSKNVVTSGPRWVWGRSSVLKNAAAAYFTLS